MKNKTLKESQQIMAFYESTRLFYRKYEEQMMEDYKQEMERRADEHKMDFEEYCLAVLYLMFSEDRNKRKETPLFLNESKELMVYYQQNSKKIKRSWDKSCDDNLFEWVLTSYDRHKANQKGTISLSTIIK